MRNTEDIIRDIFVERLCVREEKVVPQALIRNDLGADSLDEIEIVMALEDEFDIDIDDEDAEKFKTFKDVVKFVQSKK